MRTQHREHGFLSCRRDHSNLQPAGLHKIDSVGSVALRKDFVTFPKTHDTLALRDFSKEGRDVRIYFGGRYVWRLFWTWHKSPPPTGASALSCNLNRVYFARG